ncbi:hypothetical protein AOQ84DRAFT_70910 [Glonium stellatum]|uniref:Copper-fist domain-containing protein n=1 Tax=Glonium stellatum TaxID=574774 RepID=A0A8E2EXM2_9PEZI|nr:hypothetical protein AOQ84DRAFT_70910 [Glonium stellatum]
MPWLDVNGERKKVACGPCIRGHRSSKCDHKDRVLLEVRKPGRPLSSCPHPVGSCSCERLVINYTIPKTSECACPSENTPVAASSTPAPTGGANRVQKSRHRKSTSTFNPTVLQRAIEAKESSNSSASSQPTKIATNVAFLESEPGSSNGPSPTSSTSSTPHMNPTLPRRQSYDSAVQISERAFAGNGGKEWPHIQTSLNGYRAIAPESGNLNGTSDCWKPKPKPKMSRQESEPLPRLQSGECCSSKPTEPVKEAQVKNSCCSGTKREPQTEMVAPIRMQPPVFQNVVPYQQLGPNGQFHNIGAAYASIHGQMNMGNQQVPFALAHTGNTPSNAMMLPGYDFGPPMFAVPTVCQHHQGFGMASNHATNDDSANGLEHNCQCGDGCACFGCAAHPHNATMTHYLREMSDFMRNGGTHVSSAFNVPTYPHQPAYPFQHQQNFAYNPNSQSLEFPRLPSPSLQYQVDMHSLMTLPQQSNTDTYWPQGGMRTPVQETPTTEFEQFNSSAQDRTTEPRMPGEGKTAHSPSFVESPDNQDNDETPTLSPSSFFLQTLVLPGCNDATGTCQCGDGCECVGCLTHGGHNGISLDNPIPSEQNGYTEFVGGPNLNGNHTERDQYIQSFTDAPT